MKAPSLEMSDFPIWKYDSLPRHIPPNWERGVNPGDLNVYLHFAGNWEPVPLPLKTGLDRDHIQLTRSSERLMRLKPVCLHWWVGVAGMV